MGFQRVLEQRVTTILDRLLIKPSLASLPPLEGGLLQVGAWLYHIFIPDFWAKCMHA
jgi:hypothetical protein